MRGETARRAPLLAVTDVGGIEHLISDEAMAAGCAAGCGVGDVQLAVLTRQVQWALSDVAADLPAGRVTPVQRVRLAGTLVALAEILRASTPEAGGVR